MSKREGLFCFNVFESGSCGQLGFFFSPLIYTVCSETHQGVFALGVCFGGQPRISALRVGTATSAAPGGPVGHKTSRGLLALRLSSVHTPLPHFVGARQPRGHRKVPPGWTSSLLEGFPEEAWSEGAMGGRWRERRYGQGVQCFSRRVWIPEASDETCKEWTSSRSEIKRWPGPL